jgi:hypothetical protein
MGEVMATSRAARIFISADFPTCDDDREPGADALRYRTV